MTDNTSIRNFFVVGDSKSSLFERVLENLKDLSPEFYTWLQPKMWLLPDVSIGTATDNISNESLSIKLTDESIDELQLHDENDNERPEVPKTQETNASSNSCVMEEDSLDSVSTFFEIRTFCEEIDEQRSNMYREKSTTFRGTEEPWLWLFLRVENLHNDNARKLLLQELISLRGLIRNVTIIAEVPGDRSYDMGNSSYLNDWKNDFCSLQSDESPLGVRICLVDNSKNQGNEYVDLEPLAEDIARIVFEDSGIGEISYRYGILRDPHPQGFTIQALGVASFRVNRAKVVDKLLPCYAAEVFKKILSYTPPSVSSVSGVFEISYDMFRSMGIETSTPQENSPSIKWQEFSFTPSLEISIPQSFYFDPERTRREAQTIRDMDVIEAQTNEIESLFNQRMQTENEKLYQQMFHAVIQAQGQEEKRIAKRELDNACKQFGDAGDAWARLRVQNAMKAETVENTQRELDEALNRAPRLWRVVLILLCGIFPTMIYFLQGTSFVQQWVQSVYKGDMKPIYLGVFLVAGIVILWTIFRTCWLQGQVRNAAQKLGDDVRRWKQTGLCQKLSEHFSTRGNIQKKMFADENNEERCPGLWRGQLYVLQNEIQALCTCDNSFIEKLPRSQEVCFGRFVNYCGNDIGDVCEHIMRYLRSFSDTPSDVGRTMGEIKESLRKSLESEVQQWSFASFLQDPQRFQQILTSSRKFFLRGELVTQGTVQQCLWYIPEGEDLWIPSELLTNGEIRRGQKDILLVTHLKELRIAGNSNGSSKNEK